MKQKGFTLIELLVTMAIMSILVVITVSQYVSAKKKANDVQRKGDLSSLSRALLVYYADYGVFPTGIQERSNYYGDSVSWKDREFVDNTGYSYMKKLPTDISHNATLPYCYVVNSDGKKFGLFAQLENTTDSECSATPYVHCGGLNYCYAIVSPNTIASELEGFNQ